MEAYRIDDQLPYCHYTVPSASPNNVIVVAVTSTTIQVTWDPLPADQENGIILHYAVTVMVEQDYAVFTLNVTSTFTTISNLHPAYNYSIVVAAVTINIGPSSMPLTVITPDDGKYN